MVRCLSGDQTAALTSGRPGLAKKGNTLTGEEYKNILLENWAQARRLRQCGVKF